MDGLGQCYSKVINIHAPLNGSVFVTAYHTQPDSASIPERVQAPPLRALAEELLPKALGNQARSACEKAVPAAAGLLPVQQLQSGVRVRLYLACCLAFFQPAK